MNPTTKQRITLGSNRSVSLSEITAEPKAINNSFTRHSSQDLKPFKYDVSPDILANARRNMGAGELSPKQRPLPATPQLPSESATSQSPASPSLPVRPLLRSTDGVAVEVKDIPLSPATLHPRRPLPPLPKVPAPPVPPKKNIAPLQRATTSPVISPESHSLPPLSPTLLSDARKDPKYYSNPEFAITMKDGVCQRHLSAPSSVISEPQINSKPEDNIDGLDKSDNIDTNVNPRASLDLSSDSASPTLRSWYLKKNSTQERSKLQSTPKKERPDIRPHRKALPDMVEVTLKNKLIKEIFVTEALYVDDLNVAIKVFMDSIKRYNALSEAGTNSHLDISALFANIEELYAVNKAVLSDLVEIIPQVNENSDDASPCPPIADVFVRHLKQFSGYTTYLCNKDLSARVVKKVENMSLFNFLMSQCRENPDCNSLGLGDYLIKPVQRLCKYPLLFKELRKYMQPDDPQLPVVSHVITEIEKLTETTNQTITNTEKLNQVRKIMGNEIAPLLEGTTMVRDGVLFLIVKGSKKEEVFFWLLDKVILWHPTRATLRKVVRKQTQNSLGISSIYHICEDEYDRQKHSFSLEYKNAKGKDKQLVFCAQSYLEKLCWVEDLNSQISK